MSETIRQAAETFSCPGCGARPVWDPATQGMKCPFCDTESPVEKDRTAPAEYDLDAAPTAQQKDWGEKKRVIHCQGCGAETILSEQDTAAFCAFCGSPHVLEDQSEAGIRPESVLPFAFPQQQATSSFRSWLKGKLFAPSKAKKMAQLGQITGVYLPHWTYDDNARSRYVGQEGHYYYVTVPVRVTQNGKTTTVMKQERRTRWSPTSGVVADSFNDIVIPGSQRLEQNLLERVQPYDLTQLCAYRAEYLSGFAAEKPAVTVKEGWEDAKGRIEIHMRQLARQDILSHADEAQVSAMDTDHSDTRYKLTLLPMYLSSFTYKNKAYHVLVNGQNGKCGGQSPVSPWRVMIAVLLALALALGIGYVAGAFDESTYSSSDYSYTYTYDNGYYGF